MTELEERTVGMIGTLIDRLEEFAPHWYYGSSLITEADDLIKEIAGE